MMKKLMQKKASKKGFTLAELLIVVAIVAILVAIAIPVFGSQLDKAKQAVDDANIRSAYAQYTVDMLFDATNNSTDVSAKQATAQEALDACTAIDVTELQYYSGITIPKDGGRWAGTGTGGAESITSSTFTVES